MLDAALISIAVRYKDGFIQLQQQGIGEEHFIDEYVVIWRHIFKSKREHDTVPSPDALNIRFPELDIPNVQKRDVPQLVRQAKQRKKYADFIKTLNRAAESATDYETVDDVIQKHMGEINALSFRDGDSHLVDLFSRETSKRMLMEVHRRRSGQTHGIPTGFRKFDAITGGLQKQRMITIIGRPGLGKSWLDLTFVASAVLNGYKVMLYPLEMTLSETAFRLYTLFSQKMFGAEKVLSNFDLSRGKVTRRKMVQLLLALEDRFEGQLYVADVGALHDTYTNERIEAEVEAHNPDLFWVDYLTLLKPPPGARGGGDSDWQSVSALSKGIKNTAMRRNVVGGASAQVNREAMRTNVFLPRLEHIAYGDSIGQDADQVISINRKGDFLYYALVKNRGGMEIGKTRVSFHVDMGIVEESPEPEDVGDDQADNTGADE